VLKYKALNEHNKKISAKEMVWGAEQINYINKFQV
jgi:hypothetical protein